MNDTSGLPLRRVFLRDMMLQAQIGVYPHEHGRQQRLRLNVELGVPDAQAATGPGADDLARVVDYGQVAVLVRRIVASGHVGLVETLAERIAAAILADDRIRRVVVRVEKLDVFEDVAAVGVEIERWAPAP